MYNILNTDNIASSDIEDVARSVFGETTSEITPIRIQEYSEEVVKDTIKVPQEPEPSKD